MLSLELIGCHEEAANYFFDILEEVGVLSKSKEVRELLDDFLENNLEKAISLGSLNVDKQDDLSLDDTYFSLDAEKSETYLLWFNDFSRKLSSLGEIVEEMQEVPSIHYWWSYCPWDPDYSDESGLVYNKLKETGEFFWFLVICIQRFGSFAGNYYNLSKIKDAIIKSSKENKNSFNWSIFHPLSVWLSVKIIENEYKQKSIKSISDELLSYNIVLDPKNSADLSFVPEYEVEENYVYHKENYYDLDYVIRAITASGGFAQSLERQDLEDKITTANSLVKKNKKKKFRIKKDELRKA